MSAIVAVPFATSDRSRYNKGVSSKQNIWGTTVVSIEAAVLAACTLMAATPLEIANAVNGEEFSAAEVLNLGQASVVEYTEKQFSGATMDESIDWSEV